NEDADPIKLTNVNSNVRVSGLRFVARVVISNTGTRTLHGGVVNISVASECNLEVMDPDEKRHFVVALPLNTEKVISPDGPQSVKETVAREDFLPDSATRYHVRITAPRPGTWFVLAELSGDPPPHGDEVRFRRLEVEAGT